jgi:hypothetical protein
MSVAVRQQSEAPRSWNVGNWTGIPGIIQYLRISPLDPQVFAGLDLPAIYFVIKS